MDHVLQVDDVDLRYRSWGEADSDHAVLLIHGLGGHAHWWDHIGGLLADDFRVIAVDLAGHGDSGWRAYYDYGPWARDIVEILRSAGVSRPTLVGHSMGGFVALTASTDPRISPASVVCIDSMVTDRPEDCVASRRQRVAKGQRTFRRLRPRSSDSG